MLFSELYSSYYNAVAEILRCAVSSELTEQRLKEIVAEKAFGESAVAIPAALKNEKWQLLTNYKTPLKKAPQMPLTTVEKRWLKAIASDPRVKLFDADFGFLDGVEPLFTSDMLCYYDRYADGDDFQDENYIAVFRTILKASREKRALRLRVRDRRGKVQTFNVMPEYLEYSEKDDKFRLITSGCHFKHTVNLSNIIDCAPYIGDGLKHTVAPEIRKVGVEFDLFDGRKTLERAMLHFAHFEKTVKKNSGNRYSVQLFYDPNDETELLIRILSFGPFIKVTAPDSFVMLIKERLIKQKRCEI